MARANLSSTVQRRRVVAEPTGRGGWSVWAAVGLMALVGIGLSNLVGCSSSSSSSAPAASSAAGDAGEGDMEEEGPGAGGMEMAGPGGEMGPGMGPEGMGPEEGMEEPEGSEEEMGEEMAGMDPGMLRGPEGDEEEDQMEQEMEAMEEEMAKAMGGEEEEGMGMDEAQLAKEMQAMAREEGAEEEGLEAEMRGALGPGAGFGPEEGPGMGRGAGGGRPSFPEGSPQAAIFNLVMQLRGEAKPEELVKIIATDAKGDLAELRDGKASDEKKAALKTLVERVKFIGRPRKLPGGKLQLVLENVNAKKLIRFICRREGDSYVIQEMHVMAASRRGRRR